MTSLVDHLRSTLFEDIGRERVDELFSQGRADTFEAGHKLFERGQDANELMILRDGVVELLFPVEMMGVARELTMASVQTGTVVAWSALVSPYQFTLSARCASKCQLVSFGREVLHSFFEAQPQTGYFFMRNLAGVIGRRLQAMQTIWMRDLQAAAVRRLE